MEQAKAIVIKEKYSDSILLIFSRKGKAPQFFLDWLNTKLPKHENLIFNVQNWYFNSFCIRLNGNRRLHDEARKYINDHLSNN